MDSVGKVLDRHNGFGPGFDLCRIVLAYSVLAIHTEEVVYDSTEWYNLWPVWIVNYSILPMFFALSGFLVAGSAQRLTIRNFFINRSLRILPALLVEITLSAVVLGAIFTNLPKWAYYSTPGFFAYFTNVLGVINYRLPGVFLTNPHAEIVNRSLWTVPFEIMAYLCMALFMLSGAIKKPLYLIALVIVYFVAAELCALCSDGFSRLPLHALFEYGVAGRSLYLVPFFVCGVLFHIYRNQIPYSPAMMIAAAAAVVGIGVVGDVSWITSPLLVAMTLPLFTYVVITVGVSDVPRLPFFHRGDYSYGVYLYAYPIQQALVASRLLPPTWWSNLLASALAVTCFAAFSWHVVEKPILGLRRSFSFVSREKLVRNEEASAVEEPATVRSG